MHSIHTIHANYSTSTKNGRENLIILSKLSIHWKFTGTGIYHSKSFIVDELTLNKSEVTMDPQF